MLRQCLGSSVLLKAHIGSNPEVNRHLFNYQPTSVLWSVTGLETSNPLVPIPKPNLMFSVGLDNLGVEVSSVDLIPQQQLEIQFLDKGFFVLW